MGNEPFDADALTEHTSADEQFHEDRLDRDGIEPSQWPAQIDRAALDIQYGIAIGSTDDAFDIGGTIDRFNFGRATEDFYVEGIQALAGGDSNIARSIDRYDPTEIGDLAFHLNVFRHKLESTGQSLDIDRALAAFVEKQAASAIDASAKKERNAGAGLRQLRDTSSASDLMVTLFSDPRIDAYAQTLISQLPDVNVESQELLRKIDEPRMTTPLWAHQKRALKEWIEQGENGYVDMATATGKTVLGLAAIAYRYGELHPADVELAEQADRTQNFDGRNRPPTVLIVAGNEVLLEQWRDEFDDHLDIPKSRTEPIDTETGATVELDWGQIERIEFRTAQALLERQDFTGYDLVVLDEAHRYTRASEGGRSWGDLFATLTEQSNAVLAMSGSVDGGWAGDVGAREALEEHLDRCIRFSVPEARDRGVIADFTWQIHYAPADVDDEQRLATQTQVTASNYDAQTGTLDADALNVLETELPTPFTTYGDIRSFVQSKEGNRLREKSDEFDVFASALLARRPTRWNTSPAVDEIATLVDQHAPYQKTVVLVQSYNEAEEVRDELLERFGFDDRNVIALLSSDDDRREKIKRYNDLERGVIIGPGDLLGVGIDLPDAEIAINVARGGVNASLVQRIGRVLRNPSGDKEATFYHVIPQPTSDEALAPIEDGAQLLRFAGEYRTLGDTFKELPSFDAADGDVESTLVELENAGVELLDRIEDASVLVDEERSRKRIRQLQAAVYEANDRCEDSRNRSVLTTNWGRVNSEKHTEQTDSPTHFPERNEAYERYRLALGPYRAARAAAEHVFNLDVKTSPNEQDGGWHLELSDCEDTKFYAEFERWLNEYRKWRERCSNQEGDGEPGSLPEYKEAWPEPRDSEGAMLTAEAAVEIGVDYTDEDPIFFPHTDDGTYALPLPDNHRLTVEGIVEPETITGGGTSNKSYKLNAFVLDAARRSIEDGHVDYDDVETFVTAAVNDLLKASIDGAAIPSINSDGVPLATIQLEVDEKTSRMMDVIVEDSDESFGTPAEFVEAALRAKLDLDPGETEIVSVTLRTEAIGALEELIAAEDSYDSIDGLVRELLQQELSDKLS